MNSFFKLSLLFVIAFLVTVTTYHKASAQAFPCQQLVFPCDALWQTSLETFSLPGCGVGCTIDVLYSWRICFPNDQVLRDQQIDIRQITYSAECVNCSTNDLQAAVLEAILQRNSMNFRPNQNGQCSDQIRLMMAQCIKSYITNGGPGSATRTVIEACASGGCCWQRLRVCKNNDIVTITLLPGGFDQSSSQPDACPVYYGDRIPTDGVCYFNCDWVRHTRFVQELGKRSSTEESQNIVSNEYSGMATIYDINGKIVWQSKIAYETETDFINYLESSTKLRMGVYVYKVVNDNTTIRGRFNIK